jgi:hypothetical protein
VHVALRRGQVLVSGEFLNRPRRRPTHRQRVAFENLTRNSLFFHPIVTIAARTDMYPNSEGTGLLRVWGKLMATVVTRG